MEYFHPPSDFLHLAGVLLEIVADTDQLSRGIGVADDLVHQHTDGDHLQHLEELDKQEESGVSPPGCTSPPGGPSSL